MLAEESLLIKHLKYKGAEGKVEVSVTIQTLKVAQAAVKTGVIKEVQVSAEV